MNTYSPNSHLYSSPGSGHAFNDSRLDKSASPSRLRITQLGQRLNNL